MPLFLHMQKQVSHGVSHMQYVKLKYGAINVVCIYSMSSTKITEHLLEISSWHLLNELNTLQSPFAFIVLNNLPLDGRLAFS